jgi:hypothetical protein
MKKLFLYMCVGSALVISGCSKSFIDVNENPNSPGTSRSDWQFTGAVNTAMNGTTGPDGIGGAWTGIYGFSTSFTGGAQQKTYVFSNADFNYWDAHYDNLFDFEYVVKNAEAEGFGYLVGPAKVMQTFLFQRLVDMYGNIPYSEWGSFEHITPAYDDAKTVYENLITKLDEAIVDIKGATWPASSAADIVFKGDKTKWVQLANTLKMRILIRQSRIPGRDGYITTEIGKIVTEGTGLLNANALVNPGYVKQPSKLNFYYGAFGYNENDVEVTNHRFYKNNKFLIDQLKATNDTFRLQRKADPKINGNKDNFADYVGVPLGANGSAYLEVLVSSIGAAQVVRGEATRPMVLFTAAESYFLRAEAAQRYASVTAFGTPKELYEEGVRQAFLLDAGVGTSPSAIPAATATAKANLYLASGLDNVSWDNSTDKLHAIWFQKWIALAHFNNFEAWTEYRRTGFPDVPHSIASGAAPKKPVRFYYPISESNTNLENLQAQGTINVYDSRIFWDVD